MKNLEQFFLIRDQRFKHLQLKLNKRKVFCAQKFKYIILFNIKERLCVCLSADRF